MTTTQLSTLQTFCERLNTILSGLADSGGYEACVVTAPEGDYIESTGVAHIRFDGSDWEIERQDLRCVSWNERFMWTEYESRALRIVVSMFLESYDREL